MLKIISLLATLGVGLCVLDGVLFKIMAFELRAILGLLLSIIGLIGLILLMKGF